MRRRRPQTTGFAKLAGFGLILAAGAAALVGWPGARPEPAAVPSGVPEGPASDYAVPAETLQGTRHGIQAATPHSSAPRSPVARTRDPARNEATEREPLDAWGPAPSVPARFDRPIGRYVPERWGLAVDPDALDGVRPGSRLRFWMPGRPSLVAVVTDVRHDGDTVGIHADLEGLPRPFGMVLTQRDVTLMASVVAPEGNYRIEGVGGSGALEKEDPAALIDPGKVDALDPRTAATALDLPVPGGAL